MRTIIFGILAAFIFSVHCLKTTDATSCDDSSCNRACIDRRWKGGSCYGGICWCWRTEETGRRVEKPLTELTVPASGINATSCDDSSCNRACIDRRWKGGSCYGGICWCWTTEETGRRVEKPLTELTVPASGINATSCDDSSCNRACIDRRWEGGSCYGGICWCSTTEETGRRVEKPLTELTVPASDERPCDDAACTKERGGLCQDGKCVHSMPAVVININSPWTLLHDLPTNFRDTEGKDVTLCDVKPCLTACKKEGAFSGFCLKNLCWCTMTNEDAIEKRNVRPLIELQADISDVVTNENRCHPSDCRRQCSNDNKTGGAACFYGYCWCNNEPHKNLDKHDRKRMATHNQRTADITK